MNGQPIGLRANHLVGFDGKQHVLWQPGEVVFAGDTILYVGNAFAGQAGQWIDYGNALISPGFIDLDALGDLDTTVLTGHQVMQDGQIGKINLQDLQQQADALFAKQMCHHALRAFGKRSWRSLFHSIMPRVKTGDNWH